METIKKKKKPGPKPIEVDLQQVEYLAQFMGPTKIARALGISWDTLNRNRKRSAEFAEAIEKGKVAGIQRAAAKLMEEIDNNSFPAIAMYLKTADPDRWQEKIEHNHAIDLSKVLSSAKERIIEGKRVDKEVISVPLPKKKLTEE
jgi:hypothetical protein